MSSKYEVGSIVEGKVVKIKPFGAIVSLDGGAQGLVHISQISESFVQNISDYLALGDVINVKVLLVEESSGKISLSIKETKSSSASVGNGTVKQVPKKDKIPYKNNDRNNFEERAGHKENAPEKDKYAERTYDKPYERNHEKSFDKDKGRYTDLTFDDKMKEWLKQSNERQAGINKRNNRR